MSESKDRRGIEVIISDTDTAGTLGSEFTVLCERVVREVLNLEEDRLGRMTGGDKAAVEVGLTLTDDDGIRELNRKYLNLDRPTDVMAFGLGGEAGDEADPPAGEVLLLGDVVVSVETARSQATEYERPFPEELARLVAHGVLHLLGYPDDGKEPAAMMRAKENSVLIALGFAPDEPPGRSGRDDPTRES